MDDNQRKAKTISGIKWSMLGQIIGQGSNLLIGILLTRLLTPQDFGLITMITIFSGFLLVYQDFGLGAALIYKKDVTVLDYNTIFYVQIILGILLGGILFLSSSHLASFYNESILKPITMVISISFVIESLTYVQFTIFKKSMDFKSIFFVNSIAMIISGIVAIIMAYYGYGVWSIVVKLILLSVIKTIILWFLSSWKPKLMFSKSSLKESLSYSLPIIGNKTFVYFMRNSDNLIIGKILGSNALGIYNRAYSLMMLPITKITGIFPAVLFPSFSLINERISIFKSNWLKVNRYLSFILFPVSALMILLAKPFTLIILGKQWAEAILIIQILSVAGIAQALTNFGYVFNALGKTKLNFKLNIFISTILVLAIVFGVKYGIKGIAISYTLVALFIEPFIKWHYLKKELKLSYKEILSSFSVFLVCGLLCSIVLLLLFNYLTITLIFQLILGPILFTVLYLLFLNFFGDTTFLEIKALILKK